MAIINNVNEVLHRIRAKLYPNYLHNVEGAYIARTDDEASLSIEQVCAAMKNRGGYTGSYEDAVEHVKLFFDEAAYQLCDGFSVNTGYYSLHPRIGGTWESPADPIDPAKHPVRFSFRALKPLRDLASHIEVLIEGIADGSGFIADITDVTTEACQKASPFGLGVCGCAANSREVIVWSFAYGKTPKLSGYAGQHLTPGGMFALAGHKIKVAGDHADCGVYFVDSANPAQKVKVSGHLADNTASRIVGIIPALAAGQWRVEVVTQWTHGSALLKEPRTIAFTPVLTVA